MVTLRSANDDDGGYIEVGDSGPGIPEDEREAVLRRFYRGDGSRSTPGSGLGLSIVSAIARLHGYGLEVDGDGNGARIRMRFGTASA
jgi:signal transduction histidine kinase